MKKLILLLLPLFTYAQNYNNAIYFQNSVRSYYEYEPLSLNKTLNNIAQSRAEDIAKRDSVYFINDPFGETIYFIRKNMFESNRDYFLDASVAWTISDEYALKQILCDDCVDVGFGIAENDNTVYIVAKYDKIYRREDEIEIER